MFLVLGITSIGDPVFDETWIWIAVLVNFLPAGLALLVGWRLAEKANDKAE